MDQGSHVDPKQTPSLHIREDKTEYQKYMTDKQEYKNLRIESFMQSRDQNNDLQKYLEAKHQAYDTASFGESTSADELALKSSSSGEVEIFRQSQVSKDIDKAR